MNEKIYAIIVAAGKGSRMGSAVPKQLLPYEGTTVLETAIKKFASHSRIDSIIVVSPEDGTLDTTYREIADNAAKAAGDVRGSSCNITITRGGAERGDSVFAGLMAAADDSIKQDVDSDDVIVLIHDAARPGVTEDIILRNIDSVLKNECGVVTAIPSVDSIRILNDKSPEALKEQIEYPIMNSTVADRKTVYCVQTPQTFRLSDIMGAYEFAKWDGFTGTDDASVTEHAGLEIAIVEGSPANRKLTFQEDISMTTRVGTGYDVHRLVPERDLILCGTPVPYEKGLLGHSDADVATHAIMDALLGAAGLGDIGRHFPDNDDKYKGADSLKLLKEVKKMLGDVTINNIDVTIIAQAPKLAPYNKQMTLNISKTLEIPESAVNIKATTEEGLGFTGRGEGIAAIATCAIEGRF